MVDRGVASAILVDQELALTKGDNVRPCGGPVASADRGAANARPGSAPSQGLSEQPPRLAKKFANWDFGELPPLPPPESRAFYNKTMNHRLPEGLRAHSDINTLSEVDAPFDARRSALPNVPLRVSTASITPAPVSVTPQLLPIYPQIQSVRSEDLPQELRPHPGFVLDCRIGSTRVRERVDNGACVSMIRTAVYRTLDPSCILEARSISPCRFGVASKGGGEGAVIVSNLIANVVTTRFAADGSTFRVKEWNYIADNIAEEKLVGSGAYERFGLMVETEGDRSCVRFRNVPGKPLVPVVGQGRNKTGPTAGKTIQLVTVLSSKLEVPPQHSKLIAVDVKAQAPEYDLTASQHSISDAMSKWLPRLPDCDFLLEPSHPAFLATVCRVSTDPASGALRTVACVANDASEPLVVPEGPCGVLSSAAVTDVDVTLVATRETDQNRTDNDGVQAQLRCLSESGIVPGPEGTFCVMQDVTCAASMTAAQATAEVTESDGADGRNHIAMVEDDPTTPLSTLPSHTAALSSPLDRKRSWPEMSDPGIEEAVLHARERMKQEVEKTESGSLNAEDAEEGPPITLPEAQEATAAVRLGAELDPLASAIGRFVHLAAADLYTYPGRLRLIATEPVELQIDMKGQKPWSSQMYRFTARELEQLRGLITDFLRSGVIEPSSSEFSVSPLIQQKPDGSGRLVLDVRKPNIATLYDSYPLPHPGHVYDTLAGGKLFSGYDFKDGFYGIGLARNSRKYTAFRTVFGLFQFRRLVQGGKNSAQTFQRVANDNFLEMLYKFLVVYVDDSCIFTKDFLLSLTSEALQAERDRLATQLVYHAAELRNCEDAVHAHVQVELDTTLEALGRLDFRLWNEPSTEDAPLTGDDAMREWAWYLRHCRQVITYLRRVRDRGYTISQKKAVHALRAITFVGKVIGRSGRNASDKLVNGVANFPVPVVVKDGVPTDVVDLPALQGFLGLCGYHREGVHCFARRTALLRHAVLTANNGLARWTKELQQEFDALKASFCDRLALAVPDPGVPWILITDWALAGIGASLFQLRVAPTESKSAPESCVFTPDEWDCLVRGPRATQRPLPRLTVSKLRRCEREVIAVCSRALSAAEQRYPPREGETLAVVYGANEFDVLIRGKFVIVLTDHSSLQYLESASVGRVGRWSASISQYELAVQYWPGRLNKTDALSRWPDPLAHVPPCDEDAHVLIHIPAYEHAQARILVQAARAVRDGQLNRDILRQAQDVLTEVYAAAYGGAVVGAPEVDLGGSDDAEDPDDGDGAVAVMTITEAGLWQPLCLPEKIVAELLELPVGTIRRGRVKDKLAHWVQEALGFALLSGRRSHGRSCRWTTWSGVENQGFVIALGAAYSETLATTLDPGAVYPVNLGLGVQFDESSEAVLFAVRRTESLLGTTVGVDDGFWKRGKVVDVDDALGELSVKVADGKVVRVSMQDELLTFPIHRDATEHVVQVLQPDDFLEKQRQDPVLGRIMKAIESGDVVLDGKSLRFYAVDNDTGLLCYKPAWRRDGIAWTSPLRWCVPKSAITAVFHEAHVLDGRHVGRQDTVLRVAARYHWDGMLSDIVRLLKDCVACAAEEQRLEALGPSGTAQATRPFTMVSVDEIGPFNVSARGNTSLFSALDRCSRCHYSEPIRHQNSRDFGLAFVRLASREGWPNDVTGDKGAVITEVVPHICKGMSAHFGTAGAQNPRANPVERVHRELHASLRCFIIDEGSEDWELSTALFDLCWAAKVLPFVGVSRFFLARGREPRAPSLAGAEIEVPRGAAAFLDAMRKELPRALELAAVVDTEIRAKRVLREDGTREPAVLVEGEHVLWADPLLREGPKAFTPKLVGPYRVKAIGDPPQRVCLEVDGEDRWVGIHELRRWKGSLAQETDPQRAGAFRDGVEEPGLQVLREIRKVLEARQPNRLATGQCLKLVYKVLPWAQAWLVKRGGLAQVLRGALRRASRVRLESGNGGRTGGASYVFLAPPYRCSCRRCVRFDDAVGPADLGPVIMTCRSLILTEGPRCSACERECLCFCFSPVQPSIAVAQVCFSPVQPSIAAAQVTEIALPASDSDTQHAGGMGVSPLAFTLGYGDLDWTMFVRILMENAVAEVCDVRSRPRSRNACFSKDPLRVLLECDGIAYRHLPELGGRLRTTEESASSEDAGGVCGNLRSEAGQRALRSLSMRCRKVVVCVLCREIEWRDCHRQVIAQQLVEAGIAIVHLTSSAREEHPPDYVVPPWLHTPQEARVAPITLPEPASDNSPFQPHIAVAQITSPASAVPPPVELTDSSEGEVAYGDTAYNSETEAATNIALEEHPCDHSTPPCLLESQGGDTAGIVCSVGVESHGELLVLLTRGKNASASYGSPFDSTDADGVTCGWWTQFVADMASCEWVRTSAETSAMKRMRLRCSDEAPCEIHPAFGALAFASEVDIEGPELEQRGAVLRMLDAADGRIIIGKPLGEADGTRQRYRALYVTASDPAKVPYRFGKFSEGEKIGSIATAIQRIRNIGRHPLIEPHLRRFLCRPASRDDAAAAIDGLLSRAHAGGVDELSKILAQGRQPISVVIGPPGTGKSSLISSVILNGDLPSRTLCIAPSNVSVDALAEKFGETCLVIGNEEHAGPTAVRRMFHNIVPIVQGADSTDSTRRTTAARLAVWNTIRVVLATPYAAATAPRRIAECIDEDGRTDLGRCEFRTVVVDEAAATLAVDVAGCLAFGCERVILVGDPMQLPPFTGNISDAAVSAISVAVSQGVDEILCLLLETQYRMHPTIAEFPARHFYRNKLLSGVAAPERPSPPGFQWPDPQRPVCFVPVSGPERSYEHSLYNENEIKSVRMCCVQLLSAGLPATSIGVITPYRAQVQRIREDFKRSDPVIDYCLPAVEVASIDSYQGREKEVIIFSTVRSNSERRVGFTSDTTRINVAFTRARRGFIVIGDPRTLESDKTTWRKWLRWTQRAGLIQSDLCNSYPLNVLHLYTLD